MAEHGSAARGGTWSVVRRRNRGRILLYEDMIGRSGNGIFSLKFTDHEDPVGAGGGAAR